MSQQNPIEEAPAKWVHLMQDQLWTECGLYTTSQNYVTDCQLCITCPECLAFMPVVTDEAERHDILDRHEDEQHDVTGVATKQYGNLWQNAPWSLRIGILLSILLALLGVYGLVYAALVLLSTV